MAAITADKFPAIHRAFELISHDMGSGAGHDSYEVPQSFLIASGFDVDAIETALAGLTADELETFCIGEQGDADIICSSIRHFESRQHAAQ